MGSDSLSHIHIVAEAEQLSTTGLESSSVSYSYKLDPLTIVNDLTGLKEIFEKEKKHPFTISLLLDKQNNLDAYVIANLLSLILAHPRYFKYNGQWVVGLIPFNDNAPVGKELMDNLESLLKKQGFNNVSFWLVGQEKKDSKQPYVFFDGSFLPEQAFEEWYSLLLSSGHPRPNLIIYSREEDLQIIKDLISLRNQAEIKMKTGQPSFYKLVELYQSEALKVIECQSLIEVMSDDIYSKKIYLGFLLGKFKDGRSEDLDFNEIMKVRNFYHQEYEVLPLWYKRFGHIIKVMTGKRTLRSLFDKNAKKYKY